MARFWWWLAILVVFVGAFARAWSRPSAVDFDVPSSEAFTPGSARSEPLYRVTRVSSGRNASVHSATAIELDGGELLASWYGGSREGAKDVAIYQSRYDPETDRWSDERVSIDRASSARELKRYVRKLGNPVLFRDATDRIWQFYVSVSVGGWSGSAINVRWSDDGGHSFGAVRRLVSSPFMNISTLVKGPAFDNADGTVSLPVYHELIGKFGELLRVDRRGRVIDKQRLSSGITSLQPVIAVADGETARAFFRKSGSSAANVLTASTTDAGEHWSELAATSLPNPDAAIACIRTREGELIMAFNDSTRDRSSLSLAVSRDFGESFETLARLPVPPGPAAAGPPRLSYPWLMQASSGELHLFYTWDRADIVHVRFNRAWLSQ